MIFHTNRITISSNFKMKGITVYTIIATLLTQLSDARSTILTHRPMDTNPSSPQDSHRSRGKGPYTERFCDPPFNCPTRKDTTEYMNECIHEEYISPLQSINSHSSEKIPPNKQIPTLKSTVDMVSNITYTTAILYFWLHLIKMIRVIYNDLHIFSRYLWISFKLSLHIVAITVYLYILFYLNEDSENNGVHLMFIIGSIEYILD